LTRRSRGSSTKPTPAQEVKGLIDKAYASAEKIIDEHWERVEAIAEALLKFETLQGEEVERIVRGERLDKPTVAELLEKEAAKTARPAKTQPAPAEGGQEPASGGDVLPSPA
jgi:cell division protease FtsH